MKGNNVKCIKIHYKLYLYYVNEYILNIKSNILILYTNYIILNCKNL